MDKLTESANRLVERELAICDCVGAYSFYLHLNWHSSILQAHIFRRCTALLFAAAYVFWTYYPHELPLPTKA